MRGTTDIFHDESECKGRFMVGLLWVPSTETGRVTRLLRDLRYKHNYHNDVHFSRLSDRILKRNLARDWFRLFEKELEETLRFSVLAVNRRSSAYDGRRYAHDFHMYNRFTIMAIWSGFRFFFDRPAREQLRIVSDGKIRRPAGEEIGDGSEVDNFEEYLPQRFEAYQAEKLGVVDTLTREQGQLPARISEVMSVHTTKTSERDFTSDEELVQLCDLALGAVQQAFTASCKSPSRAIKRELARRACRLIRETEPTSRTWSKYFKRFNVSCFPDQSGSFVRTRYPLQISDRELTTLDDF